jgi:hypothetical protein
MAPSNHMQVLPDIELQTAEQHMVAGCHTIAEQAGDELAHEYAVCF